MSNINEFAAYLARKGIRVETDKGSVAIAADPSRVEALMEVFKVNPLEVATFYIVRLDTPKKPRKKKQ